MLNLIFCREKKNQFFNSNLYVKLDVDLFVGQVYKSQSVTVKNHHST